MSVRPPVPDPTLKPLPTDEVPADATRDERPAAHPEGDTQPLPELMNEVT